MLRLRCSFLTLTNSTPLSLSLPLSHCLCASLTPSLSLSPPPAPTLSNKSSCLIPPRAQGVLLFKAQSVFSPFHPAEEAELTSADPRGQSPSQPRPASHSFSQSLIHCSFCACVCVRERVKRLKAHLSSPPFHGPTLLQRRENPERSQEGLAPTSMPPRFLETPSQSPI